MDSTSLLITATDQLNDKEFGTWITCLFLTPILLVLIYLWITRNNKKGGGQ